MTSPAMPPGKRVVELMQEVWGNREWLADRRVVAGDAAHISSQNFWRTAGKMTLDHLTEGGLPEAGPVLRTVRDLGRWGLAALQERLLAEAQAEFKQYGATVGKQILDIVGDSLVTVSCRDGYFPSQVYRAADKTRPGVSWGGVYQQDTLTAAVVGVDLNSSAIGSVLHLEHHDPGRHWEATILDSRGMQMADVVVAG